MKKVLFFMMFLFIVNTFAEDSVAEKVFDEIRESYTYKERMEYIMNKEEYLSIFTGNPISTKRYIAEIASCYFIDVYEHMKPEVNKDYSANKYEKNLKYKALDDGNGIFIIPEARLTGFISLISEDVFLCDPKGIPFDTENLYIITATGDHYWMLMDSNRDIKKILYKVNGYGKWKNNK